MSDLIDREKAVNIVANVQNIIEHMDTVNDSNINLVKRAVERILAELPTVDAVPVRHGKWIECHDDSDWIVCSKCGKAFNLIDNCTEEFNYCPNCGARMDAKPTVDAVPVVRCSECKWNSSNNNWVDCMISEMYGRNASDNYCSLAERKDNGTHD